MALPLLLPTCDGRQALGGSALSRHSTRSRGDETRGSRGLDGVQIVSEGRVRTDVSDKNKVLG